MKLLILFLICCMPLGAYQHEVAICAIFQNEARFMREWIEFHQMIGVDHFYLYNNQSTDAFREVLQPYIEQGVVDLKEWNGSHNTMQEWNRIQCRAYEHCVKRTQKAVKWLALIDLDEFIVPVQTQNLKLFLQDYEEFSGVGMNWQNYGTSSVEKIPEEMLMIEILNQKMATYADKNRTTKCIVKPQYTHHIINPHWVFFSKGYKVNADKVPFIYGEAPTIAIDKIRLNHYIMRDRDYLVHVKHPRIRNRHSDYTLEQLLESDAEYCQEVDDVMEPFVPALKARIYE